MAINLIQEHGKETVMNQIYKEIQRVYLSDTRPWVIGYSGGKDSTLTAMVVFEAISQLPEEQRSKEIHIVSSDTMVENPLILNYLQKNIDMMNDFSKESHLNIYSKLVKPETSETFWSLLLGKGYPSPRQKFRWCTHRLKIKPIDVYINQLAIKHGSVVVVLGVRSAESNSRKSSIEEHTIDGKTLKTHTTNSNAFVYAPIEHLSNDDVWASLLNTHTPWGFDNNLLLSLYRDASDESECPVQQDVNAPSCGQSRFGCWVCTVVVKDKSLTGFIYTGYEELEPLLEFRNTLVELRENPEYRQNYRMNGKIYYVGSEENGRRGLGPFSLEGRKKLMRSLLNAQVEFNKILKYAEKMRFTINQDEYYELITKDELEYIRELWIEEGDWADSLPSMYEEIIGKPFYSGYINQPFISQSDESILESICSDVDIDTVLIKSLITLENKYLGLNTRTAIYNKIDKILNQDIVHEEILELHRRDSNETKTTDNQ
ncbi:DNA phosphorothioation system sulfurtransferase DndC [Clostridium sediminicola]|uniref:DNA phosphorothioation system sulfurtransferase DndC n=1 Tax=Clostridium sediminicola TaxID=3114879 RepID=UPI0031F24D5E